MFVMDGKQEEGRQCGKSGWRLVAAGQPTVLEAASAAVMAPQKMQRKKSEVKVYAPASLPNLQARGYRKQEGRRIRTLARQVEEADWMKYR